MHDIIHLIFERDLKVVAELIHFNRIIEND